MEKNLLVLKCPSCGTNVKSKKNNIFECEYCGTIFSVTQSRTSSDNADIGSLIELCRNAINGNNAEEALYYANKILECDATLGEGWELKFRANYVKYNNCYENFDEFISCAEQAIKYNQDNEERNIGIYSTILEFIFHKTEGGGFVKYQSYLREKHTEKFLDEYVFNKNNYQNELEELYRNLSLLARMIPVEYYESKDRVADAIHMVHMVINVFINDVNLYLNDPETSPNFKLENIEGININDVTPVDIGEIFLNNYNDILLNFSGSIPDEYKKEIQKIEWNVKKDNSNFNNNIATDKLTLLETIGQLGQGCTSCGCLLSVVFIGLCFIASIFLILVEIVFK